MPADYPLPVDEQLGFSSDFGPRAPDPSFQPLGHISLDWEDYEREPTLASRWVGRALDVSGRKLILMDVRADGKATIATFFLLKSLQGRGLGRYVALLLCALTSDPSALRLSAAMDAVESLAASSSYAAKTITLNTMMAENQSSRAWNEELLGATFIPGSRINQHWYERRGYVVYKVRNQLPPFSLPRLARILAPLIPSTRRYFQTQPRYEYTHPKTGVKTWISAAVSSPLPCGLRCLAGLK